VLLEVYGSLFMSIAEQMGAALANTAHSVNIKERLDFSCALFDGGGGLVANAPHIPVHLGSMGDSVRAIIASRGASVRPGDAFALNDPYRGGTHLPDITVVTPVFVPSEAAPLFWAASRGHHADVGGVSPGSMPSRSRTVHEEGVLITDFHLVSRGLMREMELRALLSAGATPCRNVDQNVADLRAQLAANELGARELHRLLREQGRETVTAHMAHVQTAAEASVRRALAGLQGGSAMVRADNGAQVAVRVTIDQEAGEAVIDFEGTSAQRDDNFNAPTAVCRAAVLYVLRCLAGEEIPLNEGCLKPVRLLVPEGSLLSPAYPAAVAAGNVETSQMVVDALLAAFGAQAGSQGTMNNLTFGSGGVQYYETLCGGSGAGPGFDGVGPVHTHMTNSRLTDPEVLEQRYPVLLEAFAARRGSGGAGCRRGGEGLARRLRFLREADVSLLANRHEVPPAGLAGGGDGAPGRATIHRTSGECETLPSQASATLHAGDVLEILTPGGAGYGAPGPAGDAPADREV
jgi:5-oxoprolinase (ATP-hydrolysing)